MCALCNGETLAVDLFLILSEMAPLFHYLNALADKHNIALVLVHHTRKRKIFEQRAPINQDETIGSSIINRAVAQHIGLQYLGQFSDATMGSRQILVRNLKGWYRKFPPFAFEIINGEGVDEVDMSIDLHPSPAFSL